MSNSDHNWNTYRSYRGLYRRRIAETKRLAYDRFIVSSDNKQKSIWKLINYERVATRSQNNHSISADELNSYFVTIANDIVNSLPDTGTSGGDVLSKIPSRSSSFFLRPVGSVEVFSVINNLKNKNCFDYYGLNSKILKNVSDIIAQPLSDIINACFIEGIFPQVLKISRVVPLYKKGDASNPNSYRPIAIVPILGKVFEALLKIRLLDFLESERILSPHQYGFRGGCSSTSAVSELIKDVVEGFDGGRRTELMLCDLTKAFDCVSPGILLKKMDKYGVRGTPLKLFNSYLTNRSQYVDLNEKQSTVLLQNFGVPQGSVLGPILFLIYINDLPSFMTHSSTLLFADDTTLYTTDKELSVARNRMADAVEQASLWFAANKLLLNNSKTQVITLTTDKRIPVQDPVCLLGITLDQHLTWGPQIDRACSRVSSGLYALRKLVGLVSTDVLKTAYFALVHSHLIYGITLWGEASEFCRLFVLQKRAIRIMVQTGPREHCSPWFRKLRILTLPCEYIYRTCLCIHPKAASLPTPADLHNHGTRGRNLLSVPPSRTCTSAKNKINLKVFNALPDNLKTLTCTQFKLKLKWLLMDRAFYSIEEFLCCRW